MQPTSALAVPSITVIERHLPIQRPAREVWSIIGNFETAGAFLNVTSRLVAGSGALGSIRQIGDSILEVMVGQSELSYTYAQVVGPMAPHAYHGNLSVAFIDEYTASLRYVLVYDQSAMDQSARLDNVNRLGARFQGAIEAMRQAVEHAH